MKKLAFWFTIFGLGAFTIGCAGNLSNIMRSWEWHHYGDLIASWGPPQQVFDDGSDGRILVWTEVHSYTIPGKTKTYTTGRATIYDNYIWGAANTRTTITPAQTYEWTDYYMFWINRKGYIYRWAYR